MKVGELIVRKRDGKYEYRFEIESVDNRRRWRSRGGFRLKREAIQAGKEDRENYINTKGKPLKKGDNISFATLSEIFINHVLITKEPTTYSNYKTCFDKYFIPVLGKMAVKDIDYDDIEKALVLLYEQNLSNSRIDNARIALSGAFEYAIKPLHIIRENPVNLASVMTTDKPVEEREPYSNEEIKALLDYVSDNDLYRIFVLLGLYCGMRIGEILGLCWEDIDTFNNTISVNKQMANMRYEGKSFQIIKCPKSEHSVRTIPFNSTIRQELLFLKKRHREDLELFGEEYLYPQVKTVKLGKRKVQKVMDAPRIEKGNEVLGLVCRQRNGRHMISRTVDAFYSAASKRLGFHCFQHRARHTNATLLIRDCKMDVSLVARYLGHSPNSGLSTTLGYIHLTESSGKEISSRLENSISNLG